MTAPRTVTSPPAPSTAAFGTSPDLLARAFNAAPNGFVLVGRDGLIVAANTALETMFGHSPGALVGQPLEHLLPGTVREAHVALRDAFFERPEPRAPPPWRGAYLPEMLNHNWS